MLLPVHKLQFFASWRRGHAAYDPLAGRSLLRGPLSIQVQTVNKCNGACVMCPYSLAATGKTFQKMDESLFRKIIEEIKEIGTVNLLALMLQNEPLLDPLLERRVRTAREILGDKVNISTVTNGSLLDEGRIDSLINCGIDRIAVSIDACTRETYGKIRRGLSFEQVVRNTSRLLERAKGSRVSVVTRFLRQEVNRDEEKDFIRFWSSRGARIGIDTLTNRAGLIENYDSLKRRRKALHQRLLHPVLNRWVPCCPLPFTTMGILADGRSILCCHDWEHHEIMGTISSQSLPDIWNGEPMNRYRRLLWEKRAAESDICRGCSLSSKFWGD